MGNSEDGKSTKLEESSSTTPDQGNIHMYPDWAAMQAYYGPRVAVPPYVNSAVASGEAPQPYMWGPLQPVMPPYGAPYAGIYAHGGVYAHPGIPIVSRPQGQGVTSSPAVSQTMDAASLSMGASAKSSRNTDQGLISKLKGCNGPGLSVGHCNVDNGDGTDRTDHGPQSGQSEGSSDGSNIHSEGEGEISKKRSRETTPNNPGDGKGRTLCSPQSTKEVNGALEKENSVAEKVVGTFSPNKASVLQPRNPVCGLVKSSPTNISGISPSVRDETWLQNERELKQEKRKQSNRESARRSRLRKQAEAEELAIRVQSLTSENSALKSEIDKFAQKSEKLKLENIALMERLKNKGDKRREAVGTADLLTRVNNSSPLDRTNEEGEIRENTKPVAKLHQLLNTNHRTDAVAAR